MIEDFNMEVLLKSIAKVETNSSNGIRFESSYLPKNHMFVCQGKILVGTGTNYNKVCAPRFIKWGEWSAASYGPWQILYHSAADMGFSGHPILLMTDSQYWVEKMLKRILGQNPSSIAQIADAWNTGNFRDLIRNDRYEKDVVEAYREFSK